MRARVGFRDYAIIVGICWVSGIVVGTALYFALEMPMGWWLLLPFALPMAAVVTLPYAAIAGILACIALLLALKLGFRAASPRAWLALGGVLGAAIGALHPLNLLGALIDHLVSGPHMEISWTFLAVTGTSGAVAGVLVAAWYHGPAIATEPEERTALTRQLGQSPGQTGSIPASVVGPRVGHVSFIVLLCGIALVPVCLLTGLCAPRPNGSGGVYLAGMRPGGLYNLYSDGEGGLLHVLVLQPKASSLGSNGGGFQLDFMSASEHIVWNQGQGERSLTFTYRRLPKRCENDGHSWSLARHNVFVVRLNDQWRATVEPLPVQSKATNSYEILREVQAALPSDPEIASLRMAQ